MGESGGPRIGLNAMTAVMGGGITAARQLSVALAEARPGWRFVLFHAHPDVAPARPLPNLEPHYLPVGMRLVRRWLWEQLELPGLLARTRLDGLLTVGGYACFATRLPQVSIWQNPNVLSRLPVQRSARTEAYIRFQRLAQRLSMAKSRMNVFQTWDSVEMARDRFAMDRVPHTAIHWGLDPPEGPPPPPLSEREPGLVLAVGHSYYHKNYEALIDGATRYAETYGGPLSVRVAGGPYTEDHHSGLMAKAEAAGGHVRFLGAIPPEQVAALYRRARVYVTTSLLETFGLTSLEAMGHGLPVVAARATCHPEVCGDAARYFDPADADDLARCLHEILTDDGAAQAFRERGLKRVKAFPWPQTGEAFAEILEAAL